MRIALLDDDIDMLDLTVCVLQGAGYQCSRFTSGRELISSLRDEVFDIFILDWNLPDVSGLSVLQWIRNKLGDSPPVLLLTSRVEDDDVIAALNAGGDDFISKPCQAAIFLARVQALARRTQAAKLHGLVEIYGKYNIDIANRKVVINEKQLDLTPREFAIALILFRSVNIVVSRAHLFETVWGYVPETETRTLDVHISKIRKKLEIESKNGYIISPLYGYGYRLEEVFAS